MIQSAPAATPIAMPAIAPGLSFVLLLVACEVSVDVALGNEDVVRVDRVADEDVVKLD